VDLQQEVIEVAPLVVVIGPDQAVQDLLGVAQRVQCQLEKAQGAQDQLEGDQGVPGQQEVVLAVQGHDLAVLNLEEAVQGQAVDSLGLGIQKCTCNGVCIMTFNP
jgi:hypothetical protein